MAASTLLGVALVALVALATVAVALVVWDHAREAARAENDRAVQQSQEAIQTSLGRLLATLRGADGLVGERGEVDPASFQAFARAVSVLPAAETLGLAESVAAGERATFESRTGIRIVEPANGGVSRPAPSRAAYLPVVSVWPASERDMATLGLDLLVDPALRQTLARANQTREAAFTDLVTLPGGRPGMFAFKPLYDPSEQAGEPVGYVTASFGTRVVADILGALTPEISVRLLVGPRLVYESDEPPTSGASRSLVLGGHRWVVTAQGESPSRQEPLAILVAGFTLAALLAAFTGSRTSFERRLVRANTAEREARERAELLERNAAHLAGAATVSDVAESTVADLTAAGIEVVAVHALRGDVVERLAVSTAAGSERATTESYDLDADTAGAEAIRTGEVVEIASGKDYDERFPGTSEARRRNRIENVIAVPLRVPGGVVIGALIAASRDPRWLDRSMRLLVAGVAEQCGLALERARLQAIDQDARRRASIMQYLGTSLSAAVRPSEVAEACVPSLFDAFAADVCLVTIVTPDDQNLLSVSRRDGVEERRWEAEPWVGTPAGEARSDAGGLVEAHSPDEAARLYGEKTASELVEFGVESMVLIPLRGAAGSIGVAFCSAHVLNDDDRRLLTAIRDELSRALDRATLFDAERDARRRAELMEQNAAHLAAATTPTDVARSTVEDFEGFGADVVYVWRLRDPTTLEALASTRVPTGDPGAVRHVSRRPRRAGRHGAADRDDRGRGDGRGVRRALPGACRGAPAPRVRVDGRRAACATRCKRRGCALRRLEAAPLAERRPSAAAARRGRADRRRTRARDAVRDRARGAPPRRAAGAERGPSRRRSRESTTSPRRPSPISERAGFRFAAVLLRAPEGIELLAAAGLPTEESETSGGRSRRSRTRSAPTSSAQARSSRWTTGARSPLPHLAERRASLPAPRRLLAVPLRAADRQVIGVLEDRRTRRLPHAQPAPGHPGRRRAVRARARACAAPCGSGEDRCVGNVHRAPRRRARARRRPWPRAYAGSSRS